MLTRKFRKMNAHSHWTSIMMLSDTFTTLFRFRMMMVNGTLKAKAVTILAMTTEVK